MDACIDICAVNEGDVAGDGHQNELVIELEDAFVRSFLYIYANGFSLELPFGLDIIAGSSDSEC